MPESDRTRRIRAWVAVALWVGVILAFSSDAFSAERTGDWLRSFMRAFFPEFRGARLAALHANLRKGAHLVSYGVLALLTLRAMALSFAGGFTRHTAATLALVGSVAIADEVHQSTTSTREGSRADVALDLAGGGGALAGLAAVRAARRPRADA